MKTIARQCSLPTQRIIVFHCSIYYPPPLYYSTADEIVWSFDILCVYSSVTYVVVHTNTHTISTLHSPSLAVQMQPVAVQLRRRIVPAQLANGREVVAGQSFDA